MKTLQYIYAKNRYVILHNSSAIIPVWCRKINPRYNADHARQKERYFLQQKSYNFSLRNLHHSFLLSRHRVYFSNAFRHYVRTHGPSWIEWQVVPLPAMGSRFINHLVDSMRPAGKSLFSKCSCCRPGIRHAQNMAYVRWVYGLCI